MRSWRRQKRFSKNELCKKKILYRLIFLQLLGATMICTNSLRSPAPDQLRRIPEYAPETIGATAVPVLGELIQANQEISLRTKITDMLNTIFPNTRPFNAAQLDALISVKNSYKIAGVVRDLVECALLVGWIAFRVFDMKTRVFLCLVVSVTYGLEITSTLLRITHNNQIRRELQQSGSLPHLSGVQ